MREQESFSFLRKDAKDFRLAVSGVCLDRVVLGLRAGGKAQVLEALARQAGAHLELDAATILAAILARERLGSTGLGRGFALPHVRLADVQAPVGFLVRLAHPIDFDAIDGQPVDIVYLLLMPLAEDGANIAALASVSRTMRSPATLTRIRTASSPAALSDL